MRPGPHDPGDGRLLTTCVTQQEAIQIRSGLRLRGIESSIRERKPNPMLPRSGRAIEIHVAETVLERAREALPYIVEAIVGDGLAVDADGRCALCGYDMRGISRTTICPECGEDLASVAAKRRAGRLR